MKLALAQMTMQACMEDNLKKTFAFCEKAAGSDLLFFRRSSFHRFFRSMKSRRSRSIA